MSLSCMVKDGFGPPISWVLTLRLVSVLEQPTEEKAATRTIDKQMAVDLIFIIWVFGFCLVFGNREFGGRRSTGTHRLPAAAPGFARRVGADGCVHEFLLASSAAKIEHLAVALGLKGRGFIHRHSADGILRFGGFSIHNFGIELVRRGFSEWCNGSWFPRSGCSGV